MVECPRCKRTFKAWQHRGLLGYIQGKGNRRRKEFKVFACNECQAEIRVADEKRKLDEERRIARIIRRVENGLQNVEAEDKSYSLPPELEKVKERVRERNAHARVRNKVLRRHGSSGNDVRLSDGKPIGSKRDSA